MDSQLHPTSLQHLVLSTRRFTCQLANTHNHVVHSQTLLVIADRYRISPLIYLSSIALTTINVINKLTKGLATPSPKKETTNSPLQVTCACPPQGNSYTLKSNHRGGIKGEWGGVGGEATDHILTPVYLLTSYLD